MRKNRGVIILLGMIGLQVLLLSRFYHIQVKNNSFYKKLGRKQHLTTITIHGKRGVILDRCKRPLAISIEVPSCYVIPPLVRDPQSLSEKLSGILDMPFSIIYKRLTSKKKFRWLKRYLTKQEHERLKKLSLSCIGFIKEPKRFYPNHKLASHVIGFCGVDEKGLAGIELSFDNVLRGKDGKIIVYKDAINEPIFSQYLPTLPASSGYNVQLTIDAVIQLIVEKNIESLSKKYSPLSVCGIVMDINSGEILAMANLPNFDPNDIHNPDPIAMKNIAIIDVYEPGSVFKPILLSYLLEKGYVSKNKKIFCENGIFKIKARLLHDHHPYGWLSVEDIIVKSSNIGMAKLGLMMNKKDFLSLFNIYDISTPTHIELPGEQNTILPPVANWSYYTFTSIPMGQEIALTPLKLITTYATLITGYRIHPHIVKALWDNNERTIKNFSTNKKERVLSHHTVSTIREILRQVVVRGTGKKANSIKYPIGGKTGTAQKIENGTYSHHKFYATFIGFAPVDNPKICVLVVANEPKGAYYGGTVCAPTVKNIIEEVLDYLGEKNSYSISPINTTTNDKRKIFTY